MLSELTLDFFPLLFFPKHTQTILEGVDFQLNYLTGEHFYIVFLSNSFKQLTWR